MDFDHWRCSWVFRISTDRDLKHHEMCQTLGGGVSIVWLRKTFKNCLSLLVSKNRSQKLIDRVRLCIWICICNCICIAVYNTMKFSRVNSNQSSNLLSLSASMWHTAIINGTPNENRTHSWRFARLACYYTTRGSRRSNLQSFLLRCGARL